MNKLIEKLKEGTLALQNDVDRLLLTKQILKEAGCPEVIRDSTHMQFFFKRKGRGWCGSQELEDWEGEVMPVHRFLLPDPKFKVGDKVRVINEDPIYTITDDRYEYENGGYAYSLLTPENHHFYICEDALKLVPEPTYKIGEEYEFSTTGTTWYKGRLLACVDHESKYIALCKNISQKPESWANIRPVQPKEISVEVWGLVSENGIFLGDTWETKVSAERCAINGWHAIPLTGKITI